MKLLDGFKFLNPVWIMEKFLTAYWIFDDPPDPAPTQSTSYSTNVPEYAQPYVENMLNAAQSQIFNDNMTGFRPYTPYSANPENYVAGPSPMQQQAFTSAANMQVPGQYGAATSGTLSAMNQLGNMQYNPLASNYMSTTAPALQNFGMTAPANVSGATGQSAQLNAVPNTQAAQLAMAPQAQAAQFAGPTGVGFERVGSQNVSAPSLQNFQMGPASQVYAQDFTRPGTAQQFMNPYIQASLQPQLQEAERQYRITGEQGKSRAAASGAFGGSREALMAAENQRNKNMAMNQMIGQGYNTAFQNAQQQFNAQQQANLQAQQANQQAGLTVGGQNLASLLGVQQLGAGQNLQAQQLNQAAGLQSGLANQQAGLQSGLANQQMAYNTALQNAQLQQQAGLANQALAGQYGLQQGQFNQAANLANQQMAGQYGLQQGNMNQAMSLANLQNQQQANLANQQMGYNVGNTNLQALLGVQQLGAGQNLQSQLANQGAYGQAQQLAANQQQFGANLGLQGIQQQLAAAGQLGNLGGAQLSAQQGIANLQNQYGQQQQQQQQNIINQAVQNFATEQQYPFMQLGMMNSMLRGLPMQQSSTQMYQAPPNPLTQLAGVASGVYGMSQPRAAGGVIKAAGGLPMRMFSDKQLKDVQKSPASSNMAKLVANGQLGLRNYINANPQAKEVLSQPLPQLPPPQQMAQAPQNRVGLDAIGTGEMVPPINAAGGGLLAFVGGGDTTTDNRGYPPTPGPYSMQNGIDPMTASLDTLLRQQLSTTAQESEAAKTQREAIEASIARREKARDSNQFIRLGADLLKQTSPFFGVGVGNAVGDTMDYISKQDDLTDKDRKELLKLAVEQDKNKETRDAQLLGTMATADATKAAKLYQIESLKIQQQVADADKAIKNEAAASKLWTDTLSKNLLNARTNAARTNTDISEAEAYRQAYEETYNMMKDLPSFKLLGNMSAPEKAPPPPPPPPKEPGILDKAKEFFGGNKTLDFNQLPK
tara:strand:+ start:1013 stop:3991 length:2979 start_codon:yes stop_codon:yes gene_type:complete